MGGARRSDQGAQKPRDVVQSGSFASCRGHDDEEEQIHVGPDPRVRSNVSCSSPLVSTLRSNSGNVRCLALYGCWDDTKIVTAERLRALESRHVKHDH